MPSIAERLAAARAELEASGFSSADAALDAEVLARHVLGWDRAQLVTRNRDPEPTGFNRTFSELIQRRLAREPVAQIVGHREFWGLEFEVTRDVLVPRPETELIVEEARAFAQTYPCQHVIDVGTGSGCIAIAIAHELPHVRVTAVDASPAALLVAQRNAMRNGVADRVAFRQSDVLDGDFARADLIVSNPPYVAEADADGLPPDVIQYEPHAALFGGADGFAVIRRLFAQAPRLLAPHGRLVVEFGFGQEHAVTALARESGWTIIHVRKDLQSIPRTLVLAREHHG